MYVDEITGMTVTVNILFDLSISVAFAVLDFYPLRCHKKAFIEIDFTVTFSTLWLTGKGRHLTRISVEPIVRLSILHSGSSRFSLPTVL
jgi:hypothetical protein